MEKVYPLGDEKLMRKLCDATFDLKQEGFMKLPRAAAMDIDDRGRLHVGDFAFRQHAGDHTTGRLILRQDKR
jgi:hypothetical protein